MNGTGEEEIIQEKKGSLAQMLFLIKIVDGISVSQSEFLEQLPGIIKKIFFEEEKPNRTVLSMFFNSDKNQKHKLAGGRYVEFLRKITSKNALERSFFEELEQKLRYYIHERSWRQVYPREYYKKLEQCIPDNISKCRPIDVVLYLWDIDDDTSDPGSYKDVMSYLFQLCEQDDMQSPEGDVLKLIAYALLCAIFPDSNKLNGYAIPFDEDNGAFNSELDREKYSIFKEHEAVRRIGEILNSDSTCYIVGSAGSGRKSIVNTYEIQMKEEDRQEAFLYYKLEYSLFRKVDKNTVTTENLSGILNDIQIKREKIHGSLTLVIDRWNGEKDVFWEKFQDLASIRKGCPVKFIFTTENSFVKVDRKMLIDLNNEYLQSRQKCAYELFCKSLNQYRKASLKEKIIKFLECLDWHFFGTKLLAETMKERNYSIEDIKKYYKNSGRIWKDEVDIFPYMKNLGLGSMESSVYDFLVCVSVMTKENETITKDFYLRMISDSADFEKVYKTAMEKSFIIEDKENMGEISFHLRPHIRQVILTMNPSFQNPKLLTIFCATAKMASFFEKGIYMNKYADSLKDVKRLVDNILQLMPYKAGQFTSLYIRFVRFIRIVEDKSETALRYLRGMEQCIQENGTEIFEEDLAAIYSEMAAVYALQDEDQEVRRVLKETVRFYAIHNTESINLLTSSKAMVSPFESCSTANILDNLFVLKGAGVSTSSKEFLEARIALSNLMIQNLKKVKYDEKEDVYRAALKHLNEVIQFTENDAPQGEYESVLAEALYARARLNHVYYEELSSNPQLQLMVDDLSRVEEMMVEIWGKYHSKLIPVYVEKAEVCKEMHRKEKVKEYLTLLRVLSTKNRESIFTRAQKKRITELRQEA